MTTENGWVTGVRFYKGDLNTGTNLGIVWTDTATLLATGEFTGETAEGWQDMTFDDPVGIVPGVVYIASY